MSALPLPHVKSKMAELVRRLHHNGWVANHDGNASLRLKGNRYLVTPTAVSKREVEPDMLLVVDADGKVLEGTRKPFGELDLHLAAYRARPDIGAVLHAHPPHSTAFGLLGNPVEPIALPEMVISLGASIPTLPRTMPKSPAGLQRFGQAISQNHAVLLQGNGVFTVGVDLDQALLRMELAEHYVHILGLAQQRGTVAPLSPSELASLLEARKKAGLQPPAFRTPRPTSCGGWKAR